MTCRRGPERSGSGSRPVPVALALLLLFSLWTPLGSAGAQSSGVPYRVVLIGDSITAGMLSGPPGPPYADVLAQQLGTDFDVVNIGCGGATTADWRPEAGWPLCAGAEGGLFVPNYFTGLALPNLPADFVTILLGTNDAIGFFEPAPIEPLVYRSNLDALLPALFDAGARTVLLMSPPPKVHDPGGEANARLLAYRTQLADLCTNDPDILCGPDLLFLLDASDFEGVDLHPTAAGHEKIGLALADDLLAHTPIEASADLLLFSWPLWPSISLSSSSLLPVVVYSSADLDAANEIERSTLGFGVRGDEDSLVVLPAEFPGGGGPACLELDVDQDGRNDLVCAFEAGRTGLDPNAGEAWLWARLRDGTALSAHVLRPSAAASLTQSPSAGSFGSLDAAGAWATAFTEAIR